jgi:hypothetical protein
MISNNSNDTVCDARYLGQLQLATDYVASVDKALRHDKAKDRGKIALDFNTNKKM